MKLGYGGQARPTKLRLLERSRTAFAQFFENLIVGYSLTDHTILYSETFDYEGVGLRDNDLTESHFNNIPATERGTFDQAKRSPDHQHFFTSTRLMECINLKEHVHCTPIAGIASIGYCP